MHELTHNSWCSLQTRLHVVNLADQLFQRSKAFRSHLTAHFTEFLELSLGFRHDKPLPGPASTANQLRDRGLEIVEHWNDKFGSSYKQVCLGSIDVSHAMALPVYTGQRSSQVSSLHGHECADSSSKHDFIHIRQADCKHRTSHVPHPYPTYDKCIYCAWHLQTHHRSGLNCSSQICLSRLCSLVNTCATMTVTVMKILCNMHSTLLTKDASGGFRLQLPEA